VALFCALLVVALGGLAPHEALEEAAQLIAKGEHARAADLLEEAAHAEPAAHATPELLGKAAQLREEHLDQPERAAALYRELLERFPSSRPARRARARLERLDALLGPGGAHAHTLARYGALLRTAAQLPPGQGVQAMEELLRADPDFPAADEARLWIGSTLAREGRHRAAYPWFVAAARASDPQVAWRAGKAAGDALLRRGDFAGARRHYAALATVGERGREQAKATAIARADALERRARRARWAWALILGFAIFCLVRLRNLDGSWKAALGRLARPPAEVIFLLPVAAVLVGLAMTGNDLVLTAVVAAIVGAIALTWLAGAVLAARAARGPLSLGARLTHASTVAVATVALLYAIVEEQQLLDFLLHTVRFGHD